jgi:DNA transposition AAA+ family ATPase
MDQNLIARLDAYCQKFKISNNKVAAGIGYTASVLSQWRKGTYKGDSLSVDAKVSSWLELQESRDEAGAVPPVALKRTERIKTAIRIAHEEKFVGLVLGNSGAGKSYALDEYALANPNTAVVVRCDPTMGLSTVVSALARSLGLDTKGRLSEISDRLVLELRRRDMVVIFDEVDYLSDSVMEWARIVINDKGGSALVLAGQPRIEHRIKGLRADHRQLENRVGMMLLVEDVAESDARQVLESVWPGLDERVASVFVGAARQSLHILVHHIALVKRALRQAGDVIPDADIATESARFLMR